MFPVIIPHTANDLMEYSPYEPINSRLSDIFRLAPIIAGEFLFLTFLCLKFGQREKLSNCLHRAIISPFVP